MISAEPGMLSVCGEDPFFSSSLLSAACCCAASAVNCADCLISETR